MSQLGDDYLTFPTGIEHIIATGRDLDAVTDQQLIGSIYHKGQQQPIIISPEGHLLAGARRLAVMRDLGCTEARVTVALNWDDVLGLVCQQEGPAFALASVQVQRAHGRSMALWTGHEPTALYRFFNRGRRLLYVGITFHPTARWRQHAKTKWWWDQVAEKTVEWHPNREAAEEAEAIAIGGEHPRYNYVFPVTAYQKALLRLAGRPEIADLQRLPGVFPK